MEGDLLIAQKVNDLITSRAPRAVCDACIVDALGFSSHAHAAQITAALGTTSDFIRQAGTCSICKKDRIVIHAHRT